MYLDPDERFRIGKDLEEEWKHLWLSGAQRHVQLQALQCISLSSITNCHNLINLIHSERQQQLRIKEREEKNILHLIFRFIFGILPRNFVVGFLWR